MLYREPITPAIIGVALVLTFTTATASEIDSSAKDQKIIVAHHVQSEGHKSAHAKHFKESNPVIIKKENMEKTAAGRNINPASSCMGEAIVTQI